MSDHFVVSVTVPDKDDVEAAKAASLVASASLPAQTIVQAGQQATSVIGVIETGPPGPPGPSGVSGMSADTVDGGELYKVILFSNGQVKAIPAGADPPSTPSGLTRTVRVNSVKVTWDSVLYGPQYVVYRNGSQVGVVSTPIFKDHNVTVGQTYNYTVQAVDSYGLRSGISSSVSAFIDPALNSPPTIEIRSWPTTVAVGSRAIIRVNAKDIDAQTLAYTLNIDVGSLVPHADPSVWILNPT